MGVGQPPACLEPVKGCKRAVGRGLLLGDTFATAIELYSKWYNVG